MMILMIGIQKNLKECHTSIPIFQREPNTDIFRSLNLEKNSLIGLMNEDKYMCVPSISAKHQLDGKVRA